MRAAMAIYDYGRFDLIKYVSADIGGAFMMLRCPLRLMRNAYTMNGYHDADGCVHV